VFLGVIERRGGGLEGSSPPRNIRPRSPSCHTDHSSLSNLVPRKCCASACWNLLRRQAERRDTMAATTTMPDSVAMGLRRGCLDRGDVSKKERCRCCKPELFTTALPAFFKRVQFGHVVQGMAIREASVLPAGHQKIAAAPCHPALALHCTKQGVAGSAHAHASTIKR